MKITSTFLVTIFLCVLVTGCQFKDEFYSVGGPTPVHVNDPGSTPSISKVGRLAFSKFESNYSFEKKTRSKPTRYSSYCR